MVNMNKKNINNITDMYLEMTKEFNGLEIYEDVYSFFEEQLLGAFRIVLDSAFNGIILPNQLGYSYESVSYYDDKWYILHKHTPTNRERYEFAEPAFKDLYRHLLDKPDEIIESEGDKTRYRKQLEMNKKK